MGMYKNNSVGIWFFTLWLQAWNKILPTWPNEFITQKIIAYSRLKSLKTRLYLKETKDLRWGCKDKEVGWKENSDSREPPWKE